MPYRVTQDALEALVIGNPQMRVTQAAVETAHQPPGAQRMRVTQIAIEFPFPGPSVVPPPPVPTPTQGDTPPAQCAPPPGAQCASQPDIQARTEVCEQLGS